MKQYEIVREKLNMIVSLLNAMKIDGLPFILIKYKDSEEKPFPLQSRFIYWEFDGDHLNYLAEGFNKWSKEEQEKYFYFFFTANIDDCSVMYFDCNVTEDRLYLDALDWEDLYTELVDVLFGIDDRWFDSFEELTAFLDERIAFFQKIVG